MNILFERFTLPDELREVIYNSPSVIIPTSKEVLFELIFGNEHTDKIEVTYDVQGRSIKEAEVVRCKNGAAVNFPEDYMRRRDPDCMRIGDDLPTDKPRFEEVYGYEFSDLRRVTLDWLTRQELVLVPFKSGGYDYGYDSVLICPRNAAFFAFAMSQLQAFVDIRQVQHFTPRAVVYVAPPFRHTRFGGKQVVVHCRSEELHEVFSYNLYPGPSAKKGIYSVLLDIGEREGWVTAHASAARIITPYENEMVMMHEGASGGGKSELLQDVMRASDGRVLLGVELSTGEERYISMSDTCTIEPVADDMAMCPPSIQKGNGKLCITDGEDGWFVRVDGIKEYGCDPMYEKIAIQSKEPLMFLNLQAVPRATCLPWEHIPDSNGQPCPNPRIIVPRRMISNVVNEPVAVDVRSFGVRMPPATAERPTYGIMGLMHIVPPALAWLWRLVAPRGFKNPSVTGKRVTQANLLLEQIISCPRTRYVLIPNQHIGNFRVGFAAEWISREYLARRGGVTMKMDRLTPARCPLLGYALKDMKVDGQHISAKFLRPETQEALGEEGYDKGAEILYGFFDKVLSVYDTEDLHPVGRQILECFRNHGSVEDYCNII